MSEGVRRGLRFGSFALAGLLFALGAGLIVWRVDERESPPGGALLAKVDDARASHTESSCVDSKEAQLFLTASRLDPQAGVLKLDVALCTPPGLLDRLDDVHGDPILSKDGELSSEVKDATVRVTLTGDVPTYAAEFKAPLATLERQSVPGPERSALVPLGRAEMPLTGQPDSYPLDWFAFTGYYNLQLPLGVSQHDIPPQAQLLGPVQVRVRAGPGVGDFRFRADEKSGGQLKLELTRERSTRLFVVLVLGVPALFAVLLGVLAIVAPGADRAQGREALVGAVAAALALLPIRQVLVPQDIDGVTLVDWALGALVLWFAGVALLWIAPRARRRA